MNFVSCGIGLNYMFTCLTLILTLFDVLLELVTFMSLEVTQAPVTRELLLL